MEHRQLGRSGLQVPVLALGTATFGGQDDFSRAIGTTVGHDQGVGPLVWSPLSWGRLTGKLRRGQTPPPKTSRLHATAHAAPPLPDDYLFNVIDELSRVADECEKSVPQVAINWVLSRPTVSSVILGARNETRLRDNLGAVGWELDDEHLRRLDEVSRRVPPYPVWHQGSFRERNPSLV